MALQIVYFLLSMPVVYRPHPPHGQVLMRLRMLKFNVGKGREIIKQLRSRVLQYYFTVATERAGYVLFRALVCHEWSCESRGNVIIDHQFVGKPKCTVIRFFNVSFVNITTLTMRCPAINLTESHITVKSSNLYGYPGINERLSFINITGKCSQALLDNYIQRKLLCYE